MLKTSHISGLMFSIEKLQVQELAIGYDESCDWVSSLTEPACHLLQKIEKVHRDHITVSRQLQPKHTFVHVITLLRASRIGNYLWYLQFKQGVADMIEAFKDLSFSIDSRSNAYVVSVTLWYLTMSPFDYKHVETICNIPDRIRITHFDYVYSGIFPHYHWNFGT